MVYSKTRPAKRKRATLESDPPRDTRMGWRRLSVRQGSSSSPAHHSKDSQSFPPCLVNSGCPGGSPPTPSGHFR